MMVGVGGLYLSRRFEGWSSSALDGLADPIGILVGMLGVSWWLCREIEEPGRKIDESRMLSLFPR